MTSSGTAASIDLLVPHCPQGTENVWHEFWKGQQNRTFPPAIRARVVLTQPELDRRQFVVETGSGHHLLVDDPAGGTGAKPIELVAAALAGCTAFDVINVLRKKRQHVTGYEVRVEADQAERPPMAFVAVRIHHMVTGRDVDPAAVSAAIRISEEKYCAVESMLKHTATITTTFEVVDDAAAKPPAGRGS